MAYECRCPVVVENAAWWRLRARCPEHDEPVRPAELEPIEDGETDATDFWIR